MEPLRPIKVKKKHGCLISFIAVIAVCVLIGALSSKFAPAAEKSASSSTDSASSSEAQNVPAKIGTEISNKKVSIKVNSVKEASSIPDTTGILQYNPDTGGKFIVINITVKNVGKELYTFVINNFQIYSTDDKQYSPNIMVANKYLNDGSINPGLSETGYIAFDVPKETKLSTLTLEFQEFLSFNEADFSLSK